MTLAAVRGRETEEEGGRRTEWGDRQREGEREMAGRWRKGTEDRTGERCRERDVEIKKWDRLSQ